MEQSVIVIIIVVLAIFAAGIKIYRFFRPPTDVSCSSDQCGNCPYNVNQTCEEGKKAPWRK
jgi:flagellar basal body-associated protein FliL